MLARYISPRICELRKLEASCSQSAYYHPEAVNLKPVTALIRLVLKYLSH